MVASAQAMIQGPAVQVSNARNRVPCSCWNQVRQPGDTIAGGVHVPIGAISASDIFLFA